MNDWKQKRGINKGGDAADIVVTKYTVTAQTARAIKKAAPTYGSEGRALQVATEMLIRMENLPVAEPEPPNCPNLVRLSMRLHKRTYRLIRELSSLKYGDDRGQAIPPCRKYLNMKRIQSVEPPCLPAR